MKPSRLLTLATLACLCWSMTSCTLTTDHGTATVDSKAAIELIRIISDK